MGRSRRDPGARGPARLKRWPVSAPRDLGLDETSFARRPEYVTAVTDLHEPRVLQVADDRRRASLDEFWQQGLLPASRAAIEAVTMDM